MQTDEELLRKLAEIEGLDDYYLENGDLHVATYGGTVSVPSIPYLWDPLTNWSDCGPLVEKYKLCTVYCQDAYGESEPNTWEIAPTDGAFKVYGRDPDLKRAICLAIIASKE